MIIFNDKIQLPISKWSSDNVIDVYNSKNYNNIIKENKYRKKNSIFI